jgi:hypothetical protein
MTRNFSLAWLAAAAVCLTSCGGTTSQYKDPPAAAPDGLNYTDPNMFTQGVTISPLVPEVRGTPSSYFVTPDLPGGLALGSDGIISGTPSEPRATATYLVTAANAFGSSTFGVRITVHGRFTVGGVVSGLSGAGLVLANNGSDNLAVNANGPFTFSAVHPVGAAYAVAVATQPAGQTCSVSAGSGYLTNTNYGGVAVTCSNNVNKATRFGSKGLSSITISKTGGVQYVACFYPPSGEAIRGYAVNPVTGAVTILGELVYQSEAALTTPLPTNCVPRSVTKDSAGMWVYVVDEDTNAVSVYEAAF